MLCLKQTHLLTCLVSQGCFYCNNLNYDTSISVVLRLVIGGSNEKWRVVAVADQVRTAVTILYNAVNTHLLNSKFTIAIFYKVKPKTIIAATHSQQFLAFCFPKARSTTQ